jgi:small conductance mechanosensitive channel
MEKYNIDLNTLELIQERAIDLAFRLGPALFKALILLLAGIYAIRFLLRMVFRALTKYEFDPSLTTFLISFLNAMLWIVLMISIATTLGVEMTSFIAILGAAGLAVGLALQGSLSNFAGGVLILVFKPFRVNDTIEAQGTIGAVESIDILYTKVRNFDNKVVTIPNGALANNAIVNYSNKPTRRVEFLVGVAYGTDIKKTRQLILDQLSSDERVLEDPAPVVNFSRFGDSSLDLVIRCWVNAENFWPVYHENMEAFKELFEANGIQIPFPQRDIHHYYPQSKPEVD